MGNSTGNTKKDEEIKVEKWDGNGLKHALDDAVRRVFIDELKYVEKNTYVDIRLLLSFLGVGVAGYALLYDFLHPFPASKWVLLFCVVSYFILMTILTGFMTFIEKNIILLASQRETSGLDPDSSWKIQTTLKRFDHDYVIEMIKIDGATKKTLTGSLTKCVSDWVDVKGVILMEKLRAEVLACHKTLSLEKKDQ